MPTVKVNESINIYYEIHGDGFPLVMIIGLGSNLVWWDEKLLEVVSSKYKTVIFDNRGSGRTDKPDMNYSMRMFADDAIGLMDELNIERAYMLGISMGGMIAQELALHYPERVEKLVLCATNSGLSLKIRILAKIALGIAKLIYKRRLKTPERALEFVFSGVFTPEFIKENPDYIRERKEKLLAHVSPFEDYFRQAKAILKFNTRKRLKNIETPTLILHGKKDSLVSYKRGLELAGLIPNSRLFSFENSGHAVFTHEPEKVIKTILDFLS